MKRIAVDMDEVMADVAPKLLEAFVEIVGRRPAPEEFRGQKLYHLPEAKLVRKVLFERGFFADLPVMEGAREGIAELQRHYEVFIVTAATDFRNSLEDKFDWLDRHFPNIPWKNRVFCGDKSIVQADYMIDDHPHNLEVFQGKGILFTAYHNVDEHRFERVDDWEQVLEFFRKERQK